MFWKFNNFGEAVRYLFCFILLFVMVKDIIMYRDIDQKVRVEQFEEQCVLKLDQIRHETVIADVKQFFASDDKNDVQEKMVKHGYIYTASVSKALFRKMNQETVHMISMQTAVWNLYYALGISSAVEAEMEAECTQLAVRILAHDGNYKLLPWFDLDLIDVKKFFEQFKRLS